MPDAMTQAQEQHQRGCLDQAARLYRQVLDSQPDHAEALHLLGVVAHQQGDNVGAVKWINRAIARNPRPAAYHANLGAVYRALGQLERAAGCCRTALRLRPNFAEAANNLGTILLDQGQVGEAAEQFRAAFRLRPDYAMACTNLGHALRLLGDTTGALAHFRQAVQLDPNLAEARNNLGGQLLLEHQQLDEALDHCRAAVRLRSNFVEAYCNLGLVCKELSDFAEAERCFRAALGYDGRQAEAWEQLAILLRGMLPEPDLAAMRLLVADPALNSGKRALLHFGLAQVLDARKAYGEAAEHLRHANALLLAEGRKRGQGYDRAAHTQFVDRLLATFRPAFFDRVRGFGVESERPIFIFGLPRSGTTLTEQVLASHSQVFGAGELHLSNDSWEMLAGKGANDAKAFVSLARLDAETARRLADQHLKRLLALNEPARHVIDKMPDNYLYLGFLAVLFPRAKFILCRRNLRDVAVSCWMTNFRHLQWTNHPDDIAERFREYQRVMEHWRQVLPVPFMEVDYEETVADLEVVARRLVAWCGLDWDPACLAFYENKRPVQTASATEVRQPIYTRSVDRWKNYENTLGQLFAKLPEGDIQCLQNP
jgi:tetratricopeptide (TPR) repeat protein